MAVANTFAFAGIEAVPVEVQVQIAPGLPASCWSACPTRRWAKRASGCAPPSPPWACRCRRKRVLINLEPADLLKEGSHFDLPLALALLAAMDVLPREEIAGYAALGELSLDGSLNPVAGVLPAAIGASARGLGLICPASQGGEAAWAGRIEVLAPHRPAEPDQPFPRHPGADAARHRRRGRMPAGPDMADVKGMETARRAVEIAAAGGHNLLLIGPPGAGKSMLAARLAGPAAGPGSASGAGGQHDPQRRRHAGRRPAGHAAAVPRTAPLRVAGGADRRRPARRPGEVSLAHRGVLFLDELPEFPAPGAGGAAPADGDRAHDGGPRCRPHHLSGAVPAGRRDEPLPLRLSRRGRTRMRARAAVRRGLPATVSAARWWIGSIWRSMCSR